ncbi:YwqG family protein [Hahella sp. CR1]|uniref:DUF1963 domain-containing protein n=1 Tax=Hahella sp. CR1 TaxID=2992807 RepID=UPI0024417ABC|nr:DUF1963 domain-containing protein [Hahella sp. CR1]MDG9669253.1 YwqG family protein [Hahella sp. CR1]
MKTTIKKFKSQIARKAIVFDIGGVQPPEDRLSSWFGKVTSGGKGEAWPEYAGCPMHALAQINLSGLPFKPKGLEDLAFICIFICPDELPDHDPNGTKWLIRTYTSTSDLVPLQNIATGSSIKALPMRPRLIEQDYPCWEDLPVDCPDEFEDEYYDLFENVDGFKLGGWPSLIQSEIFWAPWNKHDAVPDYVFQIDSTEKGGWMWGDQGVGYFGRGTASGKKNEWTLEWQCY